MQEKKFEIRAEITVRLTSQDIDDIMACALEGGINYWCGRAETVGEYLGEYASEQISRGGALILYDVEDPDEKWELDLEKFLNGFKLCIEHEDDCYKAVDGFDVDSCNIDAECADMIVQYALFGEVVYG